MISKKILRIFLTLLIVEKSWAFDVSAFCSEKPNGLYCHPDVSHEKIECPSGDITACPRGEEEMCQERGILKKYGFSGGIARCVPNIPQEEITSFCESKSVGIYCFGDDDNNIRIQCPSGLLYKCDDNPSESTKKCQRKSDTFAVCSNEGGGGSAGGNCTDSIFTVTFVVTSTETMTSTASPVTITSIATLTQTNTDTVRETLVTTVTETIGEECPITTVISSSVIVVTAQESVSSFTHIHLSSTTMVNTETSIFPFTTQLESTPTNEPDFSIQVLDVTSTIPLVSINDVETTTSICTTGTIGNEAYEGEYENPDDHNPNSTPSEEIETLTSTNPPEMTAGPNPTPDTNGLCPEDSELRRKPFQVPSSSSKYQLTPSRSTEAEARSACEAMGGRLARIQSSMTHWELGNKICEVSWYDEWEGNDYESDCIALYPGGATSSPDCNSIFSGLCEL
jgi:hypothetical protein